MTPADNNHQQALSTLDQFIAESTQYQTLIDQDNWQELESSLTVRQAAIEKLFQESPGLADNPKVKEKILQLLELDEQRVTSIQKTRETSTQELGDMKRNAGAIKSYIDVDTKP